MKQEIIVTITPDGETRIEAVGFKGSSCAAATKPLEDALGVVSGRDLKPEYHQLERPLHQKQGQS